jgi:ABC-type transport system involved in multi-copper enzyme maturation permease subunit
MEMLASLIAGLASGETAAAIRRARMAAIVYLFAAAAGLCGVGFLIGAAFIWTAGRYGSMAAALGFGIGFLIVSGIVLLVFRLSAGRRRVNQAKRRKADMTAIGVTTALALLPTLLRGKGGLAALVTPIVAAAAYAIYQENKKPGDGPDSGNSE